MGKQSGSQAGVDAVPNRHLSLPFKMEKRDPRKYHLVELLPVHTSPVTFVISPFQQVMRELSLVLFHRRSPRETCRVLVEYKVTRLQFVKLSRCT